MGQWDERDREGGLGTTTHPGGNGSAATYGREKAAEMTDQLEEAVERARVEMDRYVQTASDFIRERPVASVAGALAIGWLIGKLVSRR